MIDPDHREEMAKLAEENRAACKKSGHDWSDPPPGNHLTSCRRCGEPHPSAMEPRVTLIAGGYRAVVVPKNKFVNVERSSPGTLPGEIRWDLVTRIDSAGACNEDVRALYKLLTDGVKPGTGSNS